MVEARFYTQEYKELVELIELAEKTSDKLGLYEHKMSRFRWLLYSFLFVTGATSISFVLALNFFSFEFPWRLGLMFGGIFLLMIASIIFFFYYLQFKNYTRDFYAERKILLQLLDMIHELKELTMRSSNISVVEKAITEMRLSRIKYSSRSESSLLSKRFQI